jgi:hypothetical protein
MSTDCGALTEESAAWLGYIPSLVYCTERNTGIHGIVTPSRRFINSNIFVPLECQEQVLKAFIVELLSGQRNNLVSEYYKAFASVGGNGLISYPLCYCYEIFKQLNVKRATVKIIQILEKLNSPLNSKYSGLAWECTVQLAIILRMLHCIWTGSEGLFNLVPSGTKPDLEFQQLPEECVSLTGAKTCILNWCRSYTKPTLLYVDSANACYPEVEGFLVYYDGSNLNLVKVLGFQMKSSDVKPRNGIDRTVLSEGGVLIRGRITTKHPRAPKANWRYMTSSNVRDFIGHSLQLGMPREWYRDI